MWHNLSRRNCIQLFQYWNKSKIISVLWMVGCPCHFCQCGVILKMTEFNTMCEQTAEHCARRPCKHTQTHMPCTHTHTQTHTCTHIHAHACTHMQTHTQVYTKMRISLIQSVLKNSNRKTTTQKRGNKIQKEGRSKLVEAVKSKQKQGTNDKVTVSSQATHTTKKQKNKMKSFICEDVTCCFVGVVGVFFGGVVFCFCFCAFWCSSWFYTLDCKQNHCSANYIFPSHLMLISKHLQIMNTQPDIALFLQLSWSTSESSLHFCCRHSFSSGIHWEMIGFALKNIKMEQL